MKSVVVAFPLFLAIFVNGRSADGPADKSVPLEKWEASSFEKAFHLKLKSVSPTASKSAYVLVFEHEQTIPESKVGELRKAMNERVKGTPPPVRIVVKDADNVVITDGSFVTVTMITGVQSDAFRATVNFQLNEMDRPASVAIRFPLLVDEKKAEERK